MPFKKGFILIECCVYLVICAILTLTLMQWITQTVYQAGQITKSTERATMNTLVHDVFARDTLSAPSNRSAWITIAPDTLIWQMKEGVTVGWYLQNKQLIRKEGNYNQVSALWGKHHTSVVAYGVATFECEALLEGDAVRAIKSTLCMEQSEPSSRYVRIRNGRVK